MKRIAVFAAALVPLLRPCCSVAAPLEPVVKIIQSGHSQNADADLTEQGTKAIATFRKARKPLGDEPMWSEIIAIKVEFIEEFAQFRLDRGWKVNLHLALSLPGDLVKIPKFNSGGGSNSGHTLHYDLGGGKTPGFLASKHVSQFLCGHRLSETGRATFQAVPEMTALDTIKLRKAPRL